MQGARRGPWWYHGQAVQRRRRPNAQNRWRGQAQRLRTSEGPCQPFGTGQISPHAALSPPYWVHTQLRRLRQPFGEICRGRGHGKYSDRLLGGLRGGARCRFVVEKAVADDAIKSGHEGGLQAPTRHALGWQEPSFDDSTAPVGAIAGIPVVVEAVNAVNKSPWGRKLLDSVLHVHPHAPVPTYVSKTARKQLAHRPTGTVARPAGGTSGKVALFATCYVNRNEPQIGLDLARVFEHNGIEVALADRETCCGMPKLELGDLQAVERLKDKNIPQLLTMIERGYDIVAPIPSCVLMFKQELPLMFPDDAEVAKVRDRIFDPFEYLALRHKEGLLRTDFARPLGKVSYHVACHLRVQNIGLKTRDALQLIPGTTAEAIERCSGRNGTYAVNREFTEKSLTI